MVDVEHASVAVAVPVFACVVLSWQFNVTLAGTVNIGGIMSLTIIVLLHVPMFSHTSIDDQVLVTLYVPGHDPGVTSSAKKTGTNGLQLSVAVAVPKEGTLGQFI